MPRRDGTGPLGIGAMGLGLGPCSGRGPGCRRGFGMGLGRVYETDKSNFDTQKDALKEQRDFLKSRIEAIDKQLEEL